MGTSRAALFGPEHGEGKAGLAQSVTKSCARTGNFFG
jgi:hypothetical protein